jgi:hypothetical protein
MIVMFLAEGVCMKYEITQINLKLYYGGVQKNSCINYTSLHILKNNVKI